MSRRERERERKKKRTKKERERTSEIPYTLGREIFEIVEKTFSRFFYFKFPLVADASKFIVVVVTYFGFLFGLSDSFVSSFVVWSTVLVACIKSLAKQ